MSYTFSHKGLNLWRMEFLISYLLQLICSLHFYCSDKLRASRTAISSADISNEYTLGVPGEAFVFNHCHNKVATAEASGLTGDTSQLEQFIREYVEP